MPDDLETASPERWHSALSEATGLIIEDDAIFLPVSGTVESLKPKEERAVKNLMYGLPELLRADGVAINNCILSTRLAIDALQQLGIRARALACQVFAISPKRVAHLKRGGKVTPGAPGWSVAVGYGSTGPGWDGHLVTVVRDKTVFDVSAKQFSRPRYDMDIDATIFEAPDGFLEGGHITIGHHGSIIGYHAQPKRKDYATAADWTLPMRHYPDLVRMTRELARQ